ncbi:hypothetical protein BO221_15190 [Archangium sp. Cb G35]|nr:hypothetical protein BO221_15190 [Archangium sp. Cb G35]
MLALAGLLLVPLVGCGTVSRVVRLDTGQGPPLVVTPRRGAQPVQLREDEFKASLAKVAREVRPAANPLQHARRLMLDSLWHEDVYLKWTGRRLELDPEGEVAHRAAQQCLELTHAYGRWCERQGRPRDCLSLLKGGPVLNADGRYALAMEFALGSVWNETRDAFKDMANPEVVRSTLVSAMATYLMLWSMPEPVSKGLAASLTAGLIAYLGVDTVWSLIQGWRLLVAEADRATTFAELREAGERFGRVMGKNSARVFVLLTTAAIGNTAGLAVKGPGLPGATQAAVLAESQAGFRWAAVGEVNSVAVSAEGSFTIALAPGAVAMAAWAGDSSSPTRSTLEPGQYARESIPARGPGRDFTVAEREAVNELGRKHGCHTCGARNPGTRSGDFIPDHQPPSQLAPGQPQRLYPHCKACSLRQGGEVNAELRRK